MRKKFIWRRLSALTVALLLAGTMFMLGACGNQKDPGYTYNESITLFPSTWNTHNGNTEADTYVQGYTEMGLYALMFNEDKSNVVFVDEMATGDPKDVTESLVGKYGIAEGESGKAWQINLNPDATWENGDTITADDYVKSMQLLLDPITHNTQASLYFTGDRVIYNARNYYRGSVVTEFPLLKGEYSDEQLNTLISEGKLYFSLTHGDAILGNTLSGFYNMSIKNPQHFTDADGKDWFLYLQKTYGNTANEFGYIKVDQTNYADIKQGMTVLSGKINAILPDTYSGWYSLCSNMNRETFEPPAWSEVGIFKNSDYSFTLVFENALSPWNIKYQLTSNWLVYEPYYTEGMKPSGSLQTTNYGTTSGKYMAYGPYKLSSFQIDKEFVFVRNENWYGYKEDATNYHAGQYQTDRIVCQIIDQQSTALTEFLKGNLDQVKLTSNDLDTYKFSDYLLKRTASNTWQLTFNSDAAALQAIEKDKKDNEGNRRILAVDSFRKGISLMIDRSYVGKNIAGGSQPAYSYINDNYYYDMDTNGDSNFRQTDEAKKAILKLYGIEYGADKNYKTLNDAYRAVTGYDLVQAKAAFEQAYTEAVEEGYYTQGQNIKIDIYVSSITDQLTALGAYMNNQAAAATKGTALEGKIRFEIKVGDTKRYDDISNGRIEAIYHSYSGSYNNPVDLLGKYSDGSANKIYEYGFDPATERFSITADFGDGIDTSIRSYLEWYQSISAGGEYANNASIKLQIMAELEYQLLHGFRTLPLYVGTDSTLYSKKVEYASDISNIYVAYGGVREMTYNMNNGEWAKFCKKSKNLQYV